MQKEFVEYELALKLKELGFDEPCFGYYTSPDGLTLEQPAGRNGEFVYFAPLYQQAFKWFRHNHNLNPSIMYNGIGQWDYDLNGDWSGRVWDSYEEAELTCLGKLIEIVESKKE